MTGPALLSTRTLGLIAVSGCARAAVEAAALYFMFGNRTAISGVASTGALAVALTVVTAGSITAYLKGRPL